MRGNCWKRRAARCWPERESCGIPAIRSSYLERGDCFVSAIGLAFIPLDRSTQESVAGELYSEFVGVAVVVHKFETKRFSFQVNTLGD